MAQVVGLEIIDSGYRFKFKAVPRANGSMTPHLISTTDLKSNVKVPKKDIDGEIKRRVFALAAIVFNKFRR